MTYHKTISKVHCVFESESIKTSAQARLQCEHASFMVGYRLNKQRVWYPTIPASKCKFKNPFMRAFCDARHWTTKCRWKLGRACRRILYAIIFYTWVTKANHKMSRNISIYINIFIQTHESFAVCYLVTSIVNPS